MGEAGHNRRSSDDAERLPVPVARKDRKQHAFAPAPAKDAPAATVHRSEITEAEIDRTIADSFPASDPPFWNSGIDRQIAPRR